MSTVTGLTAERMLAIENASVVSGAVNAGTGHLHLTTHGGDDIDAGYVFGTVSDATTSVKGIVELATNAETIAGTDTARSVTPASLTAAIGAMNLPTTYQGIDSDLTAIAGLSPGNDDFIQRKSGVWVNRTMGQLSTDLNVAAAIEDGTALPRHQGLVAWNFDPAAILGQKVTGSGVLYVLRVVVPKATNSVAKILFGVQTAAASATASQNKAGLYDNTGAKLSDVDITTAIGSTGLITATLTASQNLAAGTYIVGLLFNATTPPQLWGNGNLPGAIANAGIASSVNYRFGIYSTGLTSLPSSITLASIGLTQGVIWTALST